MINMSPEPSDSTSSTVLLSMAVLPLQHAALFYRTTRRALRAAAQSTIQTADDDDEERAFTQHEVSRGLPHLSAIVTCLVWDHCKVVVRRAIATTLVEHRSVAEIATMSKQQKITKKLRAIVEVQRPLKVSDIFRVERIIDQLYCEGKKGVELFEHQLRAFGVSAMTDSETFVMRRYEPDLAVMHQIRNSFVHWMGFDPAYVASNNDTDGAETQTIFSWQVNENNVSSFVDAARTYLGVVCNRVARTIGEPPPASQLSL
jgi:hypothetical protein